MLLQFHLAALALRATWTPAGDGPSRFSKKYRDAIGQDDSKWIDGDGDGWLPSIFPETPQGWMLAIVAAALIYVLYTQQAPRLPPQGGRTGGDARAQPGEAGEAARAAFLKKYG